MRADALGRGRRHFAAAREGRRPGGDDADEDAGEDDGADAGIADDARGDALDPHADRREQDDEIKDVADERGAARAPERGREAKAGDLDEQKTAQDRPRILPGAASITERLGEHHAQGKAEQGREGARGRQQVTAGDGNGEERGVAGHGRGEDFAELEKAQHIRGARREREADHAERLGVEASHEASRVLVDDVSTPYGSYPNNAEMP